MRLAVLLRKFRANGEAGASLVELALSLPFLILILIGLADLSRLFLAYMSLTQIARQGVTVLSETAGLSQGSFSDLTDTTSAHGLAQGRVRFLISRSEVLAGQAPLQITTVFNPGEALSGSARADSVELEITAGFQPVLPAIGKLRFSVHETAGYLFDS